MTTSSPESRPRPGPWGAARGQATGAGPSGVPADAAGPPPDAPQGGPLTVGFAGRRGALFWLALKTGFFTIVTLGIYRFWMKTRLRRWYWSAIRPGGHPMEYVGDPLEKLLGFCIAVVILTFYIGIVNLLLMFVSFSVFNSSWVGYAASFAGVIPLWFYARYRARRYVLARTRWRGVRFGLEPGAWGYAGRALLHWALTLLTLGLLWPRMTFLLEKYRTDRTYFGSVRLVQGGQWGMLYQAAVPFVLAAMASAALALWLIWLDPLAPGPGGWAYLLNATMDRPGAYAQANGLGRLWLVPVCALALIYGAIHYTWQAKRLMAGHKSAPGITMASGLKPPRIAMIYVLGNALSYMVLAIGLSSLIIGAAGMFGVGILIDADATPLPGLPRWLGLAAIGVLYLGVFLLWGVLHNVFVTFPIMRHLARTTCLPRTTGLPAISQRKRDAFNEAEGFAEALDLGAAI